MTDRKFTRRSDGGVLSANHINELQAALESDDTRIKANTSDLTLVTGRVKTIEDSRVRVLRATCTNNSTLTNKTVTLPAPWETYTPANGDMFAITYTSGQAAANPTININDKGAFPVRVGNQPATVLGHATGVGGVLLYTFDGSAYHLVGSQQQANTTYDEISETEIALGTGTAQRSISGRRIKFLEDRTEARVLQAEESFGAQLTTLSSRVDGLPTSILLSVPKARVATKSQPTGTVTYNTIGDHYIPNTKVSIAGFKAGTKVHLLGNVTYAYRVMANVGLSFGISLSTDSAVARTLLRPAAVTYGPSAVYTTSHFAWTVEGTVGADGIVSAEGGIQLTTAADMIMHSVNISLMAIGIRDD